MAAAGTDWVGEHATDIGAINAGGCTQLCIYAAARTPLQRAQSERVRAGAAAAARARPCAAGYEGGAGAKAGTGECAAARFPSRGRIGRGR